jgi:hypothetical protein
MTAIWFLIIFNYQGGVALLPQTSREACVVAADWLSGHVKFPNSVSATCVQGVK